jgi:predicted Fe-Mo cluster-binding NifX family protein
LKIAVTSQNFRTVTSHAGKARRFIVYDIRDGVVSEDVSRIDLPKDMSFHAYKGEAPHPVQAAGVQRLVTGGCGDGFRGRMARLGIGLYVTDETDPMTAAMNAALVDFDLKEDAAIAGQHKHGHQHKHKEHDCGCGGH